MTKEQEMRFYVRNLPANVGDAEVKSYFSDLGDIFDVSVKNNYGFFSAKGSLKRLDKAIAKYSEKDWNGNRITLEKSEKENFMARLAKERAAGLLKNAAPSEDSTTTPDIISAPNAKKRKKKSESDSSSEESPVKIKGGVPMFSGTKSLPAAGAPTLSPAKKNVKVNDTMSDFAAYDSMWGDDNTETNSATFSSYLGPSSSATATAAPMRKSKPAADQPRHDKEKPAFDQSRRNDKVKPAADQQRWSDKEKVVPLTKIEKKRRDDERRRQSLADKAKEKRQQQSAIKSALSALDAPKGNKIVFDSEDEGEGTDKKTMLFDDDDPDDESFAIPNKEHFEGEKGRKLLQLQTQFNNDDRFKIDERFAEEESDDESGNQLDAGRKSVGPLEMVRFDPSRQTSNETKPLKLKSEKIARRAETAPAPIVSKEKFYEVSDNIQSVLREKTSGFSLLQAYGGGPSQEPEPSRQEPYEHATIRPIAKRNPLLMDSSDDESEPGDTNKDQGDESVKIWAPVVHLPSGPRDNFFFAENDPLITEAMEFMNKKNSEEAQSVAANYDATRRVLRKIFKDQVLKRAKKTDMFKKKIGGMKKRPANHSSHFKPTTQNGNFRNNSRR